MLTLCLAVVGAVVVVGALLNLIGDLYGPDGTQDRSRFRNLDHEAGERTRAYQARLRQP
jgi:hypothetical protein